MYVAAGNRIVYFPAEKGRLVLADWSRPLYTVDVKGGRRKREIRETPAEI